MNNIVYKITNKLNGKMYFGITKCSIRKRWNEHKHHAGRSTKKSHLYLAMNKYGVKNFNIELVANCISEGDMYTLEKKLIALHKTTDSQFGYNNSTGGEASSAGKKLSKEQKLKISSFQSTRKRKPHTEEARTNMSIVAKGRNMDKAVMASASNRRGIQAQNAIQIHQYGLDGKYIQSFESQKAAAKSVNGVNAFHFIRSGRLKTYKGFIWKFEN